MDGYSFVMRGLMTQQALDNVGVKQKRVLGGLSEDQIIERLGISQIDEELTSKSKRMSYVFIAIGSFENSIREFISKKLIEEKGANWWSSSVKKEVRDRAEKRKEADDNMRWLSSRGDSLIYYTEFGDLVSIISGNLELFEPHIGSLTWVQSIITPLEKMRNIIMHGGELDDRDMERVGINIRDWINQVG